MTPEYGALPSAMRRRQWATPKRRRSPWPGRRCILTLYISRTTAAFRIRGRCLFFRLQSRGRREQRRQVFAATLSCGSIPRRPPQERSPLPHRDQPLDPTSQVEFTFCRFRDDCSAYCSIRARSVGAFRRLPTPFDDIRKGEVLDRLLKADAVPFHIFAQALSGRGSDWVLGGNTCEHGSTRLTLMALNAACFKST